MEYFRLEEVAAFVNGYAFSREKYKDRGIPIIRISDIDEEIKLGNCICYPEESLEKLKEYTVKKGSLLIALSGATTGKMGVFNSDRIAYLNQRICSIFSKDKNLLQEYLIFYLKNLKEIILKNSYGGAQPNISSKWLEKRVIGIPSLTEQKKIVVILDKLVTMINKKKKQINLLEELVKSRFIEMFGDPIKNDKGWEQKFLEKISSFESKNITKYLKCNNLIWLLNLEDIERNTGKIIKKKMITKSEIPTSIIAFDENYVLYSKLRPYLNKVVLPLEEGIGTSELIPIRPRDEVNRIYLFNVLTSESVLKFLKTKVSGAKMPRIIMSDFKKLKISLPGIKLQNEFAYFATKIDKLKFEAEKSLKEMENLYESLMQKFFK